MGTRQLLAWLLVALAWLVAGCENLPGTREQQSTAAGAAAGAAVGAAVAENSLMGMLLGGAVGGAGGYLVGARTDWFEEDQDNRASAAEQAVERAREDPASAGDVAGTGTADLNDDGFVTMDELIAMEEAGLGDEEILDRLEATDQVFELSAAQQADLMDAGLSSTLVADIEEVNREERDEILARSQVISEPR